MKLLRGAWRDNPQPIQQVLVGAPALQLYCMQLSNVCANKLKYQLPLEKNENLKMLGPRRKNYQTD